MHSNRSATVPIARTVDQTSSDSRARSHNNQWRNLTLLLVSTLTVMAGATIAPSLPAMQEQFSGIRHADFWVQMVMTLPGLAIAVSAPIIGRFVDRHDKKLLLLYSVAGYGLLGTAAIASSHSLIALLILRFLLGLSVAGIMVTCTTLFSDYYHGPERGHYLGLQAAFGGFGGVVFIAVANGLADVNWLYPFALYGLAFIALPAIIVWVPKPEHTQPGHSAKTQPAGQPLSEHAAPKNTARDIFLWGCCALAIVEILVLYSIPVHLPFYLHSANGSLAELGQYSGYFIAYMLLVMAVTAGLYRHYQGVMRINRLHSLGFALLALAFTIWAIAEPLITQTQSPWFAQISVMIILTVIGLGLGVTRPNLVTWLMSRCPAQLRGQKMGKLTSCFFIGQFIAPVVTFPLIKQSLSAKPVMAESLVVASADYPILFAALGGLCLATAAGCMLYRNKLSP
ncbi:MAG TPA: MFS transporter [Marinagarivorans sp.]